MKSAEIRNSNVVELRSSIELILENDRDGLFSAANDLQAMNKSDIIEALYLMAIERGVMEASLNLGLFLNSLNRIREAIPHFQRAYELGDPNAAVALGQAYFEIGKYPDAVRWLKVAGANQYAPLWLARSYRALGDTTSATRALQDGSHYSHEAAVELVVSTDELGNEAAIHLLERHLGQGAVDVLIPLANLYSSQGNRGKEIELLRRSVVAGEGFAKHNLGVALTQAGEFKEGYELLRQAAATGDKVSPGALRRIRRKRHRYYKA